LDSPEKLKAKAEEQHVVEVSFSPSKDVEHQLKDLKYVSGVSRVGDKFRLYVEDASEAIPMLIDFCRRNLKIVSINTLRPSLEDAFVKITGLSPEVMAIEKEHAKKGESLG
jgi:ABC-2 type transport system ATP-binding protein